MSLIELRSGDITTAAAEAIVTSVSPKLTVSGGVNATITDQRATCSRKWSSATIGHAHVCAYDNRYEADEAERHEQLNELISWLASGAAYG